MRFIKRMFAAADQAAEVVKQKQIVAMQAAVIQASDEKIADLETENADLKRESEIRAADAQAWRIKYEHATQKLATTGERYDFLRFVLVKALNEAATDE